MKRLSILVLLAAVSVALPAQAQSKKVSILGDS